MSNINEDKKKASNKRSAKDKHQSKSQDSNDSIGSKSTKSASTKVELYEKNLRRMVSKESVKITKVITPIFFCMLIVVLSINFFPIFSNGIEDTAHEFGFTFYEKRDASAGSKIVSSILLALAFLIMIALVTFCMAIVILYEFERLIKCFFVFAFVIYFGFLGTAFMSIALIEYNIPMDWITVLILMYNYTGLGITVFFVGGPKVLKQTYLVILSANVALVMIMFVPDWSAWLLMLVMALWDCYAVLHETGPLNRIFNSAQGSKKLPPILYATAIWLQTNSNQEDDGQLEIGLGDFVFYSLLVGKSFSSGDLFTAIFCFVSILVGLAVTLFILLLKNMPLPALPISIALGVIANFTTKFFIVPFNDVVVERQIFI